MRLSVAMIVRDEAAQIAECLAGIAPLAPEICVIDTGSADGTVTIAQRAGARMGAFPWCGDFAAARNASLGMCTGDWIFVIDADERLAAEDLPALAALTEGPRDRCYRFHTRNYTDAAHLADFVPCAEGDIHAKGHAGWYPSTKVRLFPNGVGARFVGKVHELVNASLAAQGIATHTSEIPIHHYPLHKTSEQMARKQALYLALGREKTARQPDNPKAWAELAAQCMEMSDAAGSAAAYRQAVRLAPADPGHLAGLGSALLMLARKAEAEKALRLALRLDPTRTEAWRNLGVLFAQDAAWPKAVEAFAQAAATAPDSSEAHRHLAVALQETGATRRALDHANEALRLHPGNKAARALQEALKEQGDKETNCSE